MRIPPVFGVMADVSLVVKQAKLILFAAAFVMFCYHISAIAGSLIDSKYAKQRLTTAHLTKQHSLIGQ